MNYFWTICCSTTPSAATGGEPSLISRRAVFAEVLGFRYARGRLQSGCFRLSRMYFSTMIHQLWDMPMLHRVQPFYIHPVTAPFNGFGSVFSFASYSVAIWDMITASISSVLGDSQVAASRLSLSWMLLSLLNDFLIRFGSLLLHSRSTLKCLTRTGPDSVAALARLTVVYRSLSIYVLEIQVWTKNLVSPCAAALNADIY